MFTALLILGAAGTGIALLVKRAREQKAGELPPVIVTPPPTSPPIPPKDGSTSSGGGFAPNIAMSLPGVRPFTANVSPSQPFVIELARVNGLRCRIKTFALSLRWMGARKREIVAHYTVSVCVGGDPKMTALDQTSVTPLADFAASGVRVELHNVNGVAELQISSAITGYQVRGEVSPR